VKNKKKKTDYRFSRVKLITTPTVDYEAPGGKVNWVSFVGFSDLPKVPKNVAIIAIEGNHKSYDPSNYTQFAGLLTIKLNSTSGDLWVNPEVTIELWTAVMDFVKLHADKPVVVQCSQGEQRSVALAEALTYDTNRYFNLDMPGCKRETAAMDRGIYRAFHKMSRAQAVLKEAS